VPRFFRSLALSAALPLLAAAAAGVAAHLHYGPQGFPQLREQLAQRLGASRATAARWSWLDGLGARPVHGALGGLGLLLIGVGASGRRAPARPASVPSAEAEGAFGRLEALEPPPARKSVKRIQRVASQIESDEGPEAAAAHLASHGLKDQAADVLVSAGLFDRAAEVRYDQNRFEEAAELYLKAGRLEAAGSIFSQIGRHEQAAECYLRAGKHSVAGEMYERAERFDLAGRCYAEIGFHRHAAQAYLKAGADAEAARALIAAFEEEGGGGTAVNDAKLKELRGLARKAGELLVKLRRPEEAENILVRAGAYGRAARVAYDRGAYTRAAELFLRVNRGDLAAKALDRAGDEIGAARHMGEYLRERGDDAEAIAHLIKAEEFAAAGDLCRKLGRFEEAGDNYARAQDFASAAEMFRACSNAERAAECYERAGRFAAAAECLAEGGDVQRRAELLERAGQRFEAGELLAGAGQLDGAIRLLQQVADKEPHYAEACSLLGAIFNQKGMHELAFKKLDEAASLGGVRRENAKAFYDLAVALEQKEDYGRAIALYERILSLDYHYRDVAERQERVRAAAERQQAQGASMTSSGAARAVASSRYRILRELGRGGMGVVYLARDAVLERDIAFKVLPEGLRGNANALRNFLREAKAAAQLNHPNIVTVYDAGESEHGFYMAMEHVQGTTLKDVVRQRGAVAPGGVVYILRQIADALAYAHGRKVVHRDIKTANIMWTPQKQVKIMDFGLARLMEEVRNSTTLISGTPFYMSPEQTLGRDIDHRTDIYSLGVTLFELATGQLPFRKGNVPYHHVHTPPPDPRQVKPDLPPVLGALILRCLEKDPAARFQSARALLDEIERLTGGAA
jgi:tetratricopeptide (TPR) repeat protein